MCWRWQSTIMKNWPWSWGNFVDFLLVTDKTTVNQYVREYWWQPLCAIYWHPIAAFIFCPLPTRESWLDSHCQRQLSPDRTPRVTKKVKKWSIQMLMMIARRHQINLDSFRLHWNIQKWNGTRISKKLLYHILSPTKIDHHFSLQTFGFAIQKNNSETSGFRLIYLKRDTKIGDLKCVNFTYPSECQR